MMLDVFQNYFSQLEGFRIVVIPVGIYIPIPNELEDYKNSKTNEESKHDKERISREELYSKVIDMSKLSFVYISMIILLSLLGQ